MPRPVIQPIRNSIGVAAASFLASKDETKRDCRNVPNSQPNASPLAQTFPKPLPSHLLLHSHSVATRFGIENKQAAGIGATSLATGTKSPVFASSAIGTKAPFSTEAKSQAFAPTKSAGHHDRATRFGVIGVAPRAGMGGALAAKGAQVYSKAPAAISLKNYDGAARFDVGIAPMAGIGAAVSANGIGTRAYSQIIGPAISVKNHPEAPGTGARAYSQVIGKTETEFDDEIPTPTGIAAAEYSSLFVPVRSVKNHVSVRCDVGNVAPVGIGATASAKETRASLSGAYYDVFAPATNAENHYGATTSSVGIAKATGTEATASATATSPICMSSAKRARESDDGVHKRPTPCIPLIEGTDFSLPTFPARKKKRVSLGIAQPSLSVNSRISSSTASFGYEISDIYDPSGNGNEDCSGWETASKNNEAGSGNENEEKSIDLPTHLVHDVFAPATNAENHYGATTSFVGIAEATGTEATASATATSPICMSSAKRARESDDGVHKRPTLCIPLIEGTDFSLPTFPARKKKRVSFGAAQPSLSVNSRTSSSTESFGNEISDIYDPSGNGNEDRSGWEPTCKNNEASSGNENEEKFIDLPTHLMRYYESGLSLRKYCDMNEDLTKKRTTLGRLSLAINLNELQKRKASVDEVEKALHKHFTDKSRKGLHNAENETSPSEVLDYEFACKHIIQWYEHGNSFRGYCVSNGISRKRKTLESIKKAINIQKLKEEEASTDTVRMEIKKYFEQKEVSQREKMKKIASKRKILTEDDEAYVLEVVRLQSHFGFTPTLRDFKNMVVRVMQQDAGPGERIKAPCNRSIERLLKVAEDRITTGVKASSIDNARSDANDETIIDTFRAKCEVVVATAVALGMIKFEPEKWRSFATVPGHCLINFDEMNSNAAKKYTAIIVDTLLLKKDWRFMKKSKVGDNGIQNFHTTLGQFSRADGHETIPPIIIHSRPQAKKIKGQPMDVPMDYYRHIVTVDEDGTFVNKHGILVLASKNGSMEKDLMMTVSDHILQYLPPEDERDPTILIMDGHASRFDNKSTGHLLSHKCIPHFLPSHSSIITQPNDNGPNGKMHSYVKAATEEWCETIGLTKKEFDRGDWNWVFITAWENYKNDENALLLRTKSNTQKDSFAKTGIKPFSKDAPNLVAAIECNGASIQMHNKEKPAHTLIHWEQLPAPSLNSIRVDEKEDIFDSLPPLSVGQTERSILDAVSHHGNELIKRWREDAAKRFSKGDGINDYSNPKDYAITKGEKLAAQHIHFMRSDRPLPPPAPPTEEEVAEQRRKDIIAIGDSILVDQQKDSQTIRGQAVRTPGKKHFNLIFGNNMQRMTPTELLQAHHLSLKTPEKSMSDAGKRKLDVSKSKKAREQRLKQQSDAKEEVKVNHLQKIEHKKEEILEYFNASNSPRAKAHLDQLQNAITQPHTETINGHTCTSTLVDSTATTFHAIHAVRTSMKVPSMYHVEEKKRRRNAFNTRYGATGWEIINQEKAEKRRVEEEEKKKTTKVEKKEAKKTVQIFEDALKAKKRRHGDMGWWNPSDSNSSKMPLKDLKAVASLMGLTVVRGKNDGSKKQQPLRDDYHKAIVTQGWTDDVVENKFEELVNKVKTYDLKEIGWDGDIDDGVGGRSDSDDDNDGASMDGVA